MKVLFVTGTLIAQCMAMRLRVDMAKNPVADNRGNTALRFNEIRVFDQTNTELNLKDAKMSDVQYQGEGSNCIDGNDGTACHSEYGTGKYFEVTIDAPASTLISKVEIVNQGLDDHYLRRLQGVVVSIDGGVFAEVPKYTQTKYVLMHKVRVEQPKFPTTDDNGIAALRFNEIRVFDGNSQQIKLINAKMSDVQYNGYGPQCTDGNDGTACHSEYGTEKYFEAVFAVKPGRSFDVGRVEIINQGLADHFLRRLQGAIVKIDGELFAQIPGATLKKYVLYQVYQPSSAMIGGIAAGLGATVLGVGASMKKRRRSSTSETSPGTTDLESFKVEGKTEV